MSVPNTPTGLEELSGPGFLSDQKDLGQHGYYQQEWTIAGTVDGLPYQTLVVVRRPRDTSAFSGTVIFEPLHLFGVDPVFESTGEMIMESGHGWVTIAAQKVTLEAVVIPADPERYSRLQIPGIGSASHDFLPPFADRAALARFWDELDAHQPHTLNILAQGAATVRANAERLFGGTAKSLIAAGFSESGHRIHNLLQSTYCVENAENLNEPALFDGYFPAGYPSVPLHNSRGAIVQILCEGDIDDPDFAYRPGLEGRQYRRPDSDDADDRYRLYELAGVAHMDCSRPPWNELNAAHGFPGYEGLPDDTRMNSISLSALLKVTLHHLIEWVNNGTVPPRAERLVLDLEGTLAKDEHGNARGGVRPVELEVPAAQYITSVQIGGGPGIERPFENAKLRRLYPTPGAYAERYRAKLDELVGEGWLLASDAERLGEKVSDPLSVHV